MRKLLAAGTAAAVVVALAVLAASVARAERPASSPASAPLALRGLAGGPPVRSCPSLALVTWPDGSKVTSAQNVAAQGMTPAYCEVTVLVPERINIMTLLPNTNWNGRYQASGNGGYAGSFFPPTRL